MANPFTQAQAPAPSMAMQLIAPEVAGQQLSNMRMQRLAQMLQERGMEPMPTQTQVIGGWAVPNSPLTGLEKVLSSVAGTYFQQKADQENMDLMKQFSQKLNSAASGAGDPTASPEASVQYAGIQPGEVVSGQAGQMGAQQAPMSGGRDQFNLPNLIRGLAIGQLGGDQASSAYYKGLTPTEMELQNKYLGIDSNTARQMKLAQMIKDGTLTMNPGDLNILPTGERIVAPDFNAGVAGGFDQQGRPIVNPIQGANQAAAERASMLAAANEGAKVGTFTSPEGDARVMTNAQALGQNNMPAGVPVALANNPFAAKDVIAEMTNNIPVGTLSAISFVESGHKEGAKNFNKNGTTDNGRFQFNSVHKGLNGDDSMTAGKFFADLYQKSGGDLEKAVKWYHGGQNTNLDSDENNRYWKKFQEAMGMSQKQGMPVQSSTQEVYAKEDAKSKVNYADKFEENLSNQLSKSSELMKRINVTEEALKEFKTGGGTETRAKVAKAFQAIGLPQSAIDKIAGGDLGAMQVVEKTALTESMLQMQKDLSSDTGAVQRTNQMLMDRFMEANPHLDTDQRAWEKLLNLQKEMYRNKLEEANDYWTYKKQNKGDVRQFPTYWNMKKSEKLDSTPTNRNPYASQKGKTPDNIQQLLNKYK